MSKPGGGRSTSSPRARWMKQAQEHRDMVGRNLRSARTTAGLSIEAAHEKTGLAAGYISRVERGLENVSLDTLTRLAMLYGVPLSSLWPR
jgi:ribosome-binding protein aMBF1 (putative translation factor)